MENTCRTQDSLTACLLNQYLIEFRYLYSTMEVVSCSLKQRVRKLLKLFTHLCIEGHCFDALSGMLEYRLQQWMCGFISHIFRLSSCKSRLKLALNWFFKVNRWAWLWQTTLGMLDMLQPILFSLLFNPGPLWVCWNVLRTLALFRDLFDFMPISTSYWTTHQWHFQSEIF